jgi:hypothetical protein
MLWLNSQLLGNLVVAFLARFYTSSDRVEIAREQIIDILALVRVTVDGYMTHEQPLCTHTSRAEYCQCKTLLTFPGSQCWQHVGKQRRAKRAILKACTPEISLESLELGTLGVGRDEGRNVRKQSASRGRMLSWKRGEVCFESSWRVDWAGLELGRENGIRCWVLQND